MGDRRDAEMAELRELCRVQAEDLRRLRDLPDVVVDATRRLREVSTGVTHRSNELRGLQRRLDVRGAKLKEELDSLNQLRHRLWESGQGPESAIVKSAIVAIERAVRDFTEEAVVAETIGDSLELAIGAVARMRTRLGVAATGSAEDTHPGHPTGEYPRAR